MYMKIPIHINQKKAIAKILAELIYEEILKELEKSDLENSGDENCIQ